MPARRMPGSSAYPPDGKAPPCDLTLQPGHLRVMMFGGSTGGLADPVSQKHARRLIEGMPEVGARAQPAPKADSGNRNSTSAVRGQAEQICHFAEIKIKNKTRLLRAS